MPARAGLQVAAVSRDSGLGMVEEPDARAAYIYNHPEYDDTALADEYARDLAAGHALDPPENYVPGDDPAQPPPGAWQDKTRRLYANWLERVAHVRHEAVFRLPTRSTDSPALRAAQAAVGHMRRPAAI